MMGDLLLVFLGAFLSLLFTILFREKIELFLLKKLSLYIPVRRKVTGLWASIYVYYDDGKPTFQIDLLLISQFGKNILAYNIIESNHNQELIGEFEEGYFTGTWKDINRKKDFKINKNYRGSFQFLLNNDNSELNGKYLGYNSGNNTKKDIISEGWYLRKLDRNIDESTQIEVINKWFLKTEMKSIEQIKQIVFLYKKAWENQNKKILRDLFIDNAKYIEGYYSKLHNLKEIETYWEEKVIKNQKNISVDIKDIFYNEEYTIVHWIAGFDDLENGIRKEIEEVAFLKIKNGKISSFEEYWISK